MKRWPCGLLVSAIAVLAIGCGDTSGDDAPASPSPVPTRRAFEPRFSYGTCGFAIPEGQVEGETLTCGTLKVQQNHADPQSEPIELAVAILNATSRSEAPDPLIYLSGGPGGPALAEDIQYWAADFAEPIQSTRDIIFFDQRGVGLSDPALDCWEVLQRRIEDLGDAADEDTPYWLAHLDALRACRARLEDEGVDANSFNSKENAADIADLAHALGYEQYNLYGVSYGTRLALTAMRDAPQNIRAVVLDSVVPLQANIYADGAFVLEGALQQLFDACAADASCRTITPDLRSSFFAAVNRLDRSPLVVQAFDKYGRRFEREVDGGDFVHLLFIAMYNSSVIPYLPSGIVAVANGDDELLSDLMSYEEISDYGDSLGMYLSVQCAEEVPFGAGDVRATRSRQFDRITELTIAEIRYIEQQCGAWGVRQAEAHENEPVHSDIPTLVLAGQFDPITPPDYARAASETLTRAYVFEFPAAAHGVLDHGCSTDIVLAFLEDPQTAPDASCIAEVPPITFELE